jgi:plastocyanin
VRPRRQFQYGAAGLGAGSRHQEHRLQSAQITIQSGQTVTWTFDDGSIPHNVTGDGWRSSDMTSGTFTHRFGSSGTYHYICTIHSGMSGEVIVQ